MNPFGVNGMFQSNSDMSANSFLDQQNIAALYPGWGINPAFRTPAHDAPYRPAYQGPNPYNSFQKPSFGGAMNQMFNPFTVRDDYFGNPIHNTMAAQMALASKTMDATVNATQNWIAPAVAIGASTAIFGGMIGRQAGGFARGAASGLGASSRVAGALGRGVGMVGGFVGGLGIGLAVTEAMETAMFQPYIRSRQMSEDLLTNFSGVTFGGGGNSITGRGLSGTQSSRIANSIDRLGIMDMTFGANQFSSIASMGMRAGLFDDVGSAGGIPKRVSDIAAQVKTILAISKDPNVASAIEELAKLRMGGASITGGSSSAAAGAYSALGNYASIAGSSVQRMMNTVGMQGQYMFQMNGLTPYLGQIAAANAFAGFSSAERMGILSPAHLARMGGVAGATQSALTAQLSGSTTMFNQMGLMNRFMGQGQTNGVVNNVAAFGAMASNNPLATQGAMTLYGTNMISQQMAKDGPKALENQAVQILQSLQRRAGPNGYSAEEVAAVMQRAMGMSPDQIQGYFSMRGAQTSPEYSAQALRAIRASGRENIRQIINQENAYSGPVGSTIAAVIRGVKTATAAVAGATAYPINATVGQLYDSIGNIKDDLMYGGDVDKYMTDDLSNKGLNMGAYLSDRTKGFGYFMRGSSMNRMTGTQSFKILSALDKAARTGAEGHQYAKQLLEGKFEGSNAAELLAKFLESQSDPALRAAYDEMGYSTKLFEDVSSQGKKYLVDISKSKSSENVANMKLMDQAAQIHMQGGGALSATIDKLLLKPEFAQLNSNLSSLGSTDAKLKKIRSLALQKLSSENINVDSGISAGSLNRVLAEMSSGTAATNRVFDEAKSSIDYKGFMDATAAIDSGAKAFVRGVSMFEKAVEKMPGARPATLGEAIALGLQKTQTGR